MPKTQPLIIEGQKVAGSIYGKLIKHFGGGTQGIYKARRAMFKARIANNIQTYIMSGIRGGWIGESTKEMDYGKSAMESWVEETFEKNNLEAAKLPECMPDIKGLCDKFAIKTNKPKKIYKKHLPKVEVKSQMGLYERMAEEKKVYSVKLTQWVDRTLMNNIGGEFVLPEERL